MRVIVCGGRKYANRELVFATLEALHTGPRGPITDLIHGNASGADKLADEWAEGRVTTHYFPAQWGRFGFRAGPMRNQQMLVSGKPDLVVAFPGGNGTEDMVRRARGAGVEVMEVTK